MMKTKHRLIEVEMQNPVFLDTTLRDGEQMSGLYFTLQEKLTIAGELDRIGIGIIEAGTPSMGKEERVVFQELRKPDFRAEVLSWNRLLTEDVGASLEAETASIHASVPTSDIMLDKKSGKDRSWVVPQIKSVLTFALEHGLTVSFGAEDASRPDPEFLKQLFIAAQDNGASRVRYADTLGIMTPFPVGETIAFLSHDLKIPIDFHGHNDFGLATANALSAWENGAQVISCSELGLGERAGNTSLEEFAAIMRCLREEAHDIDFRALRQLCVSISALLGRPVPENKPVIGKNINMHESGIHVDGILKEPKTYEHFEPGILGGTRQFVPGKHSGKKAIKHLSLERGYEIPDEPSEEFLKLMRGKMAGKRGVDAVSLLDSFLRQHGKKGER
jgi:homocitrate synthase NifV